MKLLYYSFLAKLILIDSLNVKVSPGTVKTSRSLVDSSAADTAAIGPRGQRWVVDVARRDPWT